jgi:hypothetical protein
MSWKEVESDPSLIVGLQELGEYLRGKEENLGLNAFGQYKRLVISPNVQRTK